MSPLLTETTSLDHIARLPCWSGPVEIEPLTGGITNRNYRVSERGGRRFVVRIGNDIPVHGIMRFNELAAARAAHAVGLSPKVVFTADGLLVCDYVEGRTLDPDAVRAPENRERIVDLLRLCHREIPKHLRGPVLVFWVFQVIRGYAATLREVQGDLVDRLPGLLACAEALEEAVGPVTMVFGHNDLLAANFLDDGVRLWLIDWDYAGFNSPLFDLANLSSNNGFDDAEDEALLESYFGRPADAALRRSFEAMKCASLLRETLWSAVSETYSTIDFDYRAYTRDYLARFEQALARFQG